MILSHRTENKICIISTEGDFTENESKKLLSYAIGLLHTNTRLQAMLINMKETTNMDSFGLGVIAALSKCVQRKQMGFGICQLTESINEVFNRTLLKKIISIYDTEESALEIFAGTKS
ncbi:MAG: STAS domain-containing protein [SAR324 cluster bacterium]|nr:STAS domain-containing protein [SAR324 cluster bacterium]